MRNRPTPSSALPGVAAAVTIILVIGAIALITTNQLANLRGRNIENAPQIPLLVPALCLMLLLISIGWVVWLAKRYDYRHALTKIAMVSTALLIVVTPLVTIRAFSSERDLTVISMTCKAEQLRYTGAAPLTGCTEEAVDTIVLLEGVESDEQWVPTAAVGNLTRDFTNLPGSKWKALLTVDGPPDTVAVAAVADDGDSQTRIGTFRPYMDVESGQLRWTSLIPVDTDVSQIRVLFYLSENPAAESASLRFDVRECPGQTVRRFDASRCESFNSAAGFVAEKQAAGPRTWRQPRISTEGSTLVVNNLEARTYELEPNYATIEAYTQSTDVLIIPSAMPQVEENSITVPGESTFEITINENSGEQLFTIYVFPTGPTYAQSIGEPAIS